MHQVKCVVCGKEFTSQHPLAKYCCAEHKKIGQKPILQKAQRKHTQKVSAKRREEKSNIVGVCKICGDPVLRETGKLKYCSDECATIGKNMSVKKYWKKRHTLDKEHRDRLNLELKEIRKKSQLNKNLKDLQKNGESLGLKDYDYGKYARLKGL